MLLGKKHACEISTRSGATTQDPLYPEGHPKIIEQIGRAHV